MYDYIVLYNNNNIIEGQYISLRKALKLLFNKYKVYIFKYKKSEDILYLNYPFDLYYDRSYINIIEENSEEKITSFGHIEVRLTPTYPSVKLSVNMEDF